MLHKKNEDRESCLARREFLKSAGAAAAGIYLAGDDSPAKAQTPAAAPSAKKPMIVWICTDMEALAGIDQYEQCFDPDESPKYQHGANNSRPTRTPPSPAVSTPARPPCT